MKKSVCLLILDGWGHAPANPQNAISQANTPHFDHLLETAQFRTLQASSTHVGLPKGQFGNSEVGHLTIGSGHVIPSDFERITTALTPQVILPHLNTGDIHITGLFSSGGVHAHIKHIVQLIQILLEHTNKTLFLHLITDGRDRPIDAFSQDNHALFTLLETAPDRLKVASVSGRYFAMDRDKNWERTELARLAMINQQANDFNHVVAAHREAGVSDEFLQPVSICASPISERDTVIGCNFRADRMAQIFSHLEKNHPAKYLAFGDYPLTQTVTNLFPKTINSKTLGAVVSDAGLKQLRITETEKFAHVTYFFNALNQKPLPNETRILIPSPKVSSFDLQPEMSAFAIKEQVIDHITDHSLIICNFANADMVGHTGNFDATVQAIETLDVCIGEIHAACIKHGVALMICADHGNADQMQHADGSASTTHSTAKVPLILSGSTRKFKSAPLDASLANIAPTILDLMDLQAPETMAESLLCGS